MSQLVTFGETMASFATSRIEPLRLATRLSVRLGGAESNTAIGARRLGVGTAWIGRVGDDELGHRILATLRGEGIDVGAVVLDAAAPTGLMIKERRTAGTTRVVYYRRGSAGSRLSSDDLPEQLLRDASVMHVTGITPALSASARQATFHAVEIAEAAGTTVAFDLNHRRTLWSDHEARTVCLDLIRHADVLFATADEVQMLGLDGDEERMLRTLCDLGPRTVVLKRGAAGSRALIDGHRLDAPAIPVEVVDPVGAGDAFAAGFLAGLIDGTAPVDRLRLAASVAAFVVASEGDWEGLPTSSELALLDVGAEDVLR
jgi:2-dehydro-3-deoxygluconokinase